MKQDELILQVAKDLYKLAGHIDSLFKVEADKKTILIEEVRSVLAEKSQDGKGPEIRALRCLLWDCYRGKYSRGA